MHPEAGHFSTNFTLYLTLYALSQCEFFKCHLYLIQMLSMMKQNDLKVHEASIQVLNAID